MPEKEDKNFIDITTYNKALELTSFFILNNSGTRDDLYDVLQKSILVFLNKARKGKITPGASVSTIFFGISQRMWQDKPQPSGLLEQSPNKDLNISRAPCKAQ